MGEAAADHRQRLCAAMVETAAQHGYSGATVARVVGRAGVSRATFYEHFADRDDCFLAAYRDKAAVGKRRVSLAADRAPAAGRPEAVLDALLGELAADRAAARLLLIEALAAPSPVRDEHEGLITGIDAAVAEFLDQQAPCAAIQIPATALTAGVVDVLARRALGDGGIDLSQLRSDLLRWIAAYRLPGGVGALPQRRWAELGRFAKLVEPRRPEAPALLPRGRSALPEEEAAADRRRRLLDATARLTAEDGYSALTVAEIAAAARVPRAAFYSHFESKQDALMAAQTHGLQGAMAVAAAEYSPPAPWPERARKAMRAFLVYLAEMSDYARLDFVESYAAGPAAVRHRHQNQMVFALFLEDGYRQNPDAARLPRACSEAIAGSILGLVRTLIVEGKTDRMLSLLPAAVYTVLAPFIGPQEAALQVQDRARGAG